jgi:hypothetical protein
MARDYSQLRIRAAALAHRNGWASFHIPDNWISASLDACGEDTQRQRTRLMTLQRLAEVEGLGSVDFIKLDAEGGEPEVLEGAAGMVHSAEAPIWMLELSSEEAERSGHHPRELAEVFESAGQADYSAYAIDQEERLLRPLEVPDGGDFWFNALFVPAGRAERIPASWLAAPGVLPPQPTSAPTPQWSVA